MWTKVTCQPVLICHNGRCTRQRNFPVTWMQLENYLKIYCVVVFFKKECSLKPTTLFKRDSNTIVFLWISSNFFKNTFCKTALVNCFCRDARNSSYVACFLMKKVIRVLVQTWRHKILNFWRLWLFLIAFHFRSKYLYFFISVYTILCNIF